MAVGSHGSTLLATDSVLKRMSHRRSWVSSGRRVQRRTRLIRLAIGMSERGRGRDATTISAMWPFRRVTSSTAPALAQLTTPEHKVPLGWVASGPFNALTRWTPR
jgi:hypothetical protein